MYEGPGIYRHYKGGHYKVYGLGQHESNNARLVIYSSLDVDHEIERSKAGVEFVLRPLDEHDLVNEDYDKDPFNMPVDGTEVEIGGPEIEPRFVKVA